MIDLPVTARLRFDPKLPSGAFVREGDTFTFCCLAHAMDEVRNFDARFQYLHTEPPTLFDRAHDDLIDVCTAEEWAEILEEAAKGMLRRRREKRGA